MKKQILILALVSTSLSGCNALFGDPTNSAFATPTSAGVLSRTSGSSGRTGADFSDVTGNGYAYQVGPVTDDGLQGFAGIVPGASVVAAPPGTTATMRGTFEVGLIDFILTDGTSVSGQSTFDRGDITLTVDVDAGTLTGGGTGLDGGFSNFILDENELTVDGRLDGETLTGTVTYDGVTGPLRGLVGEDEAIGAFHGHTDNQVHAGGFIAN